MLYVRNKILILLWFHFLYTEVGIFLRGYLYGNNSIVNVTEIGEGSKSLLCITNNTNCCQRMSMLVGAQGNWFFPGSNSAVPPADSRGQSGFYKNRGLSKVRLHRRDGITMSSPNGLFKCTIPDSNNQTLKIFIGVYTMGNGEISVDYIERFDLHCHVFHE